MATSNWLRLAGRVAVVTGAGSGIGASVAYSLASQGCHVILADKKYEKAEESARQCPGITHLELKDGVFASHSSHTTHLLPVKCDVTKSEEVRNLIQQADQLATRVYSDDSGMSPNSLMLDSPLASILVNCAGITRDCFLKDMTEEDFDDVINVNLRGTFLTCKYFSTLERLESLASSPFSSAIINIGSVVGLRGNKGQSNYAASKGGVYSMTLSMAKELTKYNVRANCILPGYIDTPMSAKVPEHIKNHMISNIPMNRFGTTENVSDLVLFLASERAAYITGEGVEISGSITV
mmetsp:Transcript_28277/g.40492  ORF Transcript_28277/g.40492 Transcript_28277/m.40492 type:complete len:294 (+) Transcript_28277:120-1001(+)|eukprot:CAMPEP_0172424986 /NCGR_PEP_ID=MMETSP1064-20121228/29283_1 /TAXON_ID=202472 /ORGANISM="Aulacoseira subarctica , Strain CCAP 1002/5" /LENGTH=293 /DNA_ID=CAMNT_0013167497 /DNA_START=49 /DNA_END=930 /DNA_ORIENTATION=+